MVYGYASITEYEEKHGMYNIDRQIEKLKKAGAEKIIVEKVIGKGKNQKMLELLLLNLKKDDVLMVTRINRLVRSKIGLKISEGVRREKFKLNVLDCRNEMFEKQKDISKAYSDPMLFLTLNTFFLFSEYESSIQIEELEEEKVYENSIGEVIENAVSSS